MIVVESGDILSYHGHMKDTDIIESVVSKFGSVPAAAEALCVSVRQLQRVRRAGRMTRTMRQLALLLIEDPPHVAQAHNDKTMTGLSAG